MSETAGSESSPPLDPSKVVRVLEICNKKGLHARASAKFVKLAASFDADVKVTKDGTTVDARSIMGLMMLAAAKGSEIEIAARGPDADAALAAVVALVAGGFGES